MKVAGMKRFLKSLGITNATENLKLADKIKSINLRCNGNQYLNKNDTCTFDMTNQLLFIKEYDKDNNAITEYDFDFCIDFFGIVGFSLK